MNSWWYRIRENSSFHSKFTSWLASSDYKIPPGILTESRMMLNRRCSLYNKLWQISRIIEGFVSRIIFIFIGKSVYPKTDVDCMIVHHVNGFHSDDTGSYLRPDSRMILRQILSWRL
jgi:hypothetical protein